MRKRLICENDSGWTSNKVDNSVQYNRPFITSVTSMWQTESLHCQLFVSQCPRPVFMTSLCLMFYNPLFMWYKQIVLQWGFILFLDSLHELSAELLTCCFVHYIFFYKSLAQMTAEKNDSLILTPLLYKTAINLG